MNTLFQSLKSQFAKEIKDFQITEIFVFNGEVHITSNYDLPSEVIINIENSICK